MFWKIKGRSVSLKHAFSPLQINIVFSGGPFLESGKRPGCLHMLRLWVAVEARMLGPAMEAVVLESQCAGVPGPAEAISRGSCSGYLGSRWILTPVMD